MPDVIHLVKPIVKFAFNAKVSHHGELYDCVDSFVSDHVVTFWCDHSYTINVTVM